MGRLIFILLLLVLPCLAYAESDVPGVIPGNAYIPNGTTIAVQLTSTVNSKQAIKGAVLEVSALEDITVNNTIVIESGSTGYVLISNIRPPSKFGKAGGIELTPLYIRTINGVKVPLMNGIKNDGQGHSAIRTYEQGIGGAGGAVGVDIIAGLAGIFLVYLDPSPGKEAIIPAGTMFITQINGNVDLTMPFSSLDQINSSSAGEKFDWSGNYYTNRGKMKLMQKGNKVTGSYEQGNGKLEGTVIKNTLTGSWSEASNSGYFKLTYSSEDKALQLFWKPNHSASWIEDQFAVKITSGYL